MLQGLILGSIRMTWALSKNKIVRCGLTLSMPRCKETQTIVLGRLSEDRTNYTILIAEIKKEFIASKMAWIWTWTETQETNSESRKERVRDNDRELRIVFVGQATRWVELVIRTQGTTQQETIHSLWPRTISNHSRIIQQIKWAAILVKIKTKLTKNKEMNRRWLRALILSSIILQ